MGDIYLTIYILFCESLAIVFLVNATIARLFCCFSREKDYDLYPSLSLYIFCDISLDMYCLCCDSITNYSNHRKTSSIIFKYVSLLILNDVYIITFHLFCYSIAIVLFICQTIVRLF